MRIQRLLNNNVIMATQENGDEVVIMGTGIGFKAKIGEKVDEKRIQKKFVLKEFGSKLSELIEDIPAVYLEITKEIVDFAKTEYMLEINDSIYLVLTDHIHFAIKRQAEGIDLENPFLYDIKHFYPNEFKVALRASEIIKEKVGAVILEDEVGYIAMHVIESTGGHTTKNFKEVVILMNKVIEIIKKNALFNNIDEDSLQYSRLVIHVKHFAKRFLRDQENKVKDELMDDTIRKCFTEECRCAEEISASLYQDYGKQMSQSELNYLVLHLRNCSDINT